MKNENKIIDITKILFYCVFVAFVVNACTDNAVFIKDNSQKKNKSFSKNISGSEVKYSERPIVQKAEEALIELSNKVQGFAGYYLSKKEGNFIVLIKNFENKLSAKQKVVSYFGNRYH